MDTSDIRKGLKMMVDGQPYTVVDFQFVKPGKGQAFTRVKIRNMATSAVLERTYKSGEKLEPADVEERDFQYIYPEGTDFVFMDPASGEQITVPGEKVGDDSRWLSDGMTVSVVLFNGSPIGVSHNCRNQLQSPSIELAFGLTELRDASLSLPYVPTYCQSDSHSK